MAFGAAMLLVLGAAAAFVYLRLRLDLDDRVDASLRSRVAAAADTGRTPTLAGVALEDPEESFAQLISPAGQVLATVGTLRGPALTGAQTVAAGTRPLWAEADLPGVDGRVRLLARSPTSGLRSEPSAVVVVVGQSLRDRDEALAGVVTSFALGGSVALVLASGIGYLLATAGLAPVEAMRRRAREVSLLEGDEGLPLPAARDEIRRLGETLNEMLARLRGAYERESRFVADASHELRTPIAIIKTELEGALQAGDCPEVVRVALGAAVEECDRLAQLAEDLLVVARAADGQLPVRAEYLGADRLLAGLRDRFADRAERDGRVIRTEAEDGLLVWADPLRMRQVLGNLVDNALRHGDGEITVVARQVSGGVEIDVADCGPGFPAEFVPRAFERFARGDRARSSDGVGLGLAIVAAVASAHGGAASLVEGPRTVVRIRIPNAS
ncbi:ATP-binding protein [Sporichthya sp.]|uniref:HAMP domain-containing sensor histidine kinase n=1 Tax=Sporichthya sp. TaxID=65475 RepID=UPI00184C53AB|nr:ATP-binding protein [Sporichthya sp.]MBA3742520.1 HAMP domain-containing protein [Sporichthya sp.]